MTSRRRFFQQATAAAVSSAFLAELAGAAPPAGGTTPPPVIMTSLPPPAKGPYVGSLFPFIKSQSDHNELVLSYLHKRFSDLPSWKQEAREGLLELLHYSPPECPFDVKVVEERDRGDYIQERIYFNTTPDVRVPACLLIPKSAKTKPAPAIVALHDHGGFYFWGLEKLIDGDNEHEVMTTFKKTFYGGKSVAVELVKQGYVVIVIDMFYWGERRMLLEDDEADWRERPASITAERIKAFNTRSGASEQLVGRTIFAAGFTWPGVMFWDDIRTVDYLVSRPEVDPKRIGCVGLSVGGLRSAHLAALDDRIKAAVVVGWMASFPAQLEKHVRSSIGFTKIVPGLYQYLDYPDVASIAMPSALLVINGSRDTLFEPGGVKASFDKLTRCYAKAGIPEKYRGSMYNTFHEFNLEMQQEAWEWLKRWV